VRRALLGWAKKYAAQTEIVAMRPDILTSDYHITVNAAIERCAIRLLH